MSLLVTFISTRPIRLDLNLVEVQDYVRAITGIRYTAARKVVCFFPILQFAYQPEQ